MARPKSVGEILEIRDIPAVAITRQGLFFYINEAFTHAYGWRTNDLIGQPVTKIMPENYRDAHNLGFSSFLNTEVATISGQPLNLAILYKDGTVNDAEHYILGEKIKNDWQFAATIELV
ncbi:MAG: PAS domain S-box protein [Candidatus Saccharimonadales bacterium]